MLALPEREATGGWGFSSRLFNASCRGTGLADRGRITLLLAANANRDGWETLERWMVMDEAPHRQEKLAQTISFRRCWLG